MRLVKRILLKLILFLIKKLSKVNNVVTTDLDDEHIKNARLLSNRKELLSKLPKNAKVAEIGVAEGDFSREILTICQPEKLHLIDCWDSARYHQGLKLLVEKKFDKEIQNNIVNIHFGLSTDVAGNFGDAYFDWIYIDTDHTYYTTLSELRLYSSKIKPEGIIAGHDYLMGNWEKYFKYGVIEAVHQFCKEEKWEILYLTMESSNAPSFAIRKLL